MSTLRAPGKLALMLVATLAGCYEGGALDPLSAGTTMQPPGSTYRELSLLASSFVLQSGSCTTKSGTDGVTIPPPSAGNSCVFEIKGFIVPTYTGTVRIHAGISSTNPGTMTTFSLNFNTSTSSPIFSVNLTPYIKETKDFSVAVPQTQAIDSNTRIYISFIFMQTIAPLAINRLGIEFDSPAPEVIN